MDVLISRQAAIDALEKYFDGLPIQVRYDLIEITKKLPSVISSAQPEPCEDAISRQAAIDALDCINGVEEVLKALPSAQQKPLKYSGDSICVYCMTSDCVGCVYEPMEGR